ncbi:MAG: hypothetical protein EZS28_039606 [Streblomastix strix]|uniref:Uncharacterized protein n=1 Tax=Streblomastix strix TaxID=222440 RepID=A0A5J4U2S6_9EUKA|nr:MAG: hypothetical protein EZS28_039606 [Streblomastix strix]
MLEEITQTKSELIRLTDFEQEQQAVQQQLDGANRQIANISAQNIELRKDLAKLADISQRSNAYEAEAQSLHQKIFRQILYHAIYLVIVLETK